MTKFEKNLRRSLEKPLRRQTPEEREAMAHAIESELPKFLHDAFDMEIASIYELTSAPQLQDLRNKIATTPAAARINASSSDKFDHALKHYIDFLGSKFNPLRGKGLKRLAGLNPEVINGEAINDINLAATNFTEGAIVQQTVDRRERNREARQACIEKYGCKCMVCGFDFEAVYGAVGRGYIEVHHLKPISQTDDEHEVTADDLVPLCANCHAMAHRRNPLPFTVEELKGFMGVKRLNV